MWRSWTPLQLRMLHESGAATHSTMMLPGSSPGSATAAIPGTVIVANAVGLVLQPSESQVGDGTFRQVKVTWQSADTYNVGTRGEEA